MAGKKWRHDGKSNQNVTQTKSLMSNNKPCTCVINLCKTCILLLSAANQQRETAKFCVFWRKRTAVANYSHFHLELNAGVTYLADNNVLAFVAGRRRGGKGLPSHSRHALRALVFFPSPSPSTPGFAGYGRTEQIQIIAKIDGEIYIYSFLLNVVSGVTGVVICLRCLKRT